MQNMYYCPECNGRLRDADDSGRLVHCPHCDRTVMPQVTNPETGKTAEAKSQAEVNRMAADMEEIKRRWREGDEEAAVQLYRQTFEVKRSQAKAGVHELMKAEMPSRRSWLARLFGG